MKLLFRNGFRKMPVYSKMKTIWLVVFIGIVLSGANSLMAQNAPANRYIINYEDGSVFVGNVVKANLYQFVLLASTGDSVHIEKSRILKMRILKNDVLVKSRGKFHYKKGIFASFDLGILSNSGQFDLLAGYRKNEKYSYGLGVGIHINETNISGFFVRNDFMPIYVYGRRYIGKSNVGPFVFSKLGYGIPYQTAVFDDDHSGGFFAQPGLGLHFASRSKFRFTMSLSQYIQYTTGNERFAGFFFDNFGNQIFNDTIDFDYSIWYTRVFLKVGIEFR